MNEVVIQPDALDADALGIPRHLFRENALHPNICRHALLVMAAGIAANESIVLLAPIAAVDVDTSSEMVTDFLQPFHQHVIQLGHGAVRIAALAPKLRQTEVLAERFLLRLIVFF